MTASELKEYIFNNNKVEDVLIHISCHHIKYHDGMGYYTCGNVDGDNQSAIVVYLDKYLNVMDYTRKDIGYGSDILTLVQYNLSVINKHKVGFKDAINYLCNLYGLDTRYRKKKEVVVKDPLSIFKDILTSDDDYDRDIEEIMEMDYVPYVHIDFFREGITKKTIDKFELCYSNIKKRTMIPIRYWLDGTLLAYNGRSSVENCEYYGIKKYMITKHYPKSINLYGLWENQKDIEEKGYITVFEAEKSVLKRDSLMDSTGVALTGHTMSNEQVRIILGLNIDEVVIALDKDIDINEVRNMCEKFYNKRKVSYIYDKYGLLNDKDSPADAREDIYQYLFKYRISYNSKEHDLFIESLKKGDD